jgi:hypothetical protein
MISKNMHQHKLTIKKPLDAGDRLSSNWYNMPRKKLTVKEKLI